MAKLEGQGERWRKLDNTAKLFPAIANEGLSNVYRISAVLKEEVVPGILQRALEEILPQFEGFSVRLHKGFFWYYFETNHRMPVIEREEEYPCKYIDPHNTQLFLFRLSYFGKRINLEVFHAITDGLGAVQFLKAVVYRYLDLKADERTGHRAPQRISSDVSMNVEDSYVRNYTRKKGKSYSSRKAYALKGPKLPPGEENILHGYLPMEQVKRVCKEKKVSVTKLLAASLIWSVYEEYVKGNPGKEPIGISLPINLRKYFGSQTMSNFFAVTLLRVATDQGEITFDGILAQISRQMDEQITKEKLEETISYNVSNEKKWYLRAAPLFLKFGVLNLIFWRNDKAYTMTLSNIGPIQLVKEYENQVERFQMMIGVSPRQPMKCGVCAYRQEIAVTFTSVFADTRLQDRFFGFLKTLGIDSTLESNGIPDKRDDKGTYPVVIQDPKKWKTLVHIFYGVLLSAAVVLGIINYVTYSGSLWSVIAIGCILYCGLTVKFSIVRTANLAHKLLIQTLAAQALLVAVDYATGYDGWSVNYCIPSTILFADIAVIFLILFNRLNWQSYFMYQIAITVFSFIPLILWAGGWITRPVMAVATVCVTAALLAGTIVLGDRSVKTELKRRFHL
ncbi:MAG TPA: MFS transporter [Candidatus Hungatella pullicola]|nr:MFS transporter [Candidatus Hungatella pullicola]